MGLGREVYVRRLLQRKPPFVIGKDDFYLAYHGDKDAFFRYILAEPEENDVANGEGWVSDIVVLVLRYKDSDLYNVLCKVPAIRSNYVCYIMHTYLKAEDLMQYDHSNTLYVNPFKKS